MAIDQRTQTSAPSTGFPAMDRLRRELDQKLRQKQMQGSYEHGDQLRDLSMQGLLDVQNRRAPLARGVRVGDVAQATAHQARAHTGQAATINTAPQGQFRDAQLDLARRLTGVADGSVMGAGQMAVRQEGNRALAQQQAMARMQRGGNAALAARQAATNTANIGLGVAGQAAQAQRADATAATQTLSGLLGQGREADIGLATGQAGLQQGMTLANLGAQNQAELANAAARNQVGLANMDAQNQRIFQQAQLDQSTSLANMQARLQTMGMNDQASLAYLAQLYGVDQSEMMARLEQEKMRIAQEANKPNLLGNLLQAGGTIAGAYFGGPAGAAAGGSAGRALGGG